MTRRTWVVVVGAVAVIAAGVSQLPAIAAGGLLRPHRHDRIAPTPAACVDREFDGDGLILRGWFCAAAAPRRGTIVYLHGIADNRSSSAGLIARYVPRGFDVIAYDGRAHGRSDGEFCTYGVYERRDLRKVIATVAPGPVVLIGTSLGGAVALQTAADDPRVSAVVAAEVFSDLETVARERAPRLLPEWAIRRAFRLAEEQAHFSVQDASPVRHAPRVTGPVLLLHGDLDHETPIAHSRRILAALSGRGQLITVTGAGHNRSLAGPVWDDIDRWIDQVLPPGR